jgi:hypothetical protein
VNGKWVTLRVPYPMFPAKDGGYLQKYGLDAHLVFGVHPAGITMVVASQA